MDDLFAESNKSLEFASSKRSSLQSKLDRHEVDTPVGDSVDALFAQRTSAPKSLPAIMSMLSSVLGNSAEGIQAPATQRIDIIRYPNKQN